MSLFSIIFGGQKDPAEMRGEFSEDNWCQYLVTRGALQIGNHIQFREEDIPVNGACSATGGGCEYWGGKVSCPRRKHNDLCDTPLARERLF